MITFSSSAGIPRTFQTSNYLHLKSFITFTLNSQGIIGSTTEDDIE